ncbi:PDR/VanB family oxidoreductase [Burkholderia sp. Ac-20379]|uniref:PDR/VanB family oxidoreductase n=1 Tax=Burkholderia sp. Ac-20379 TaxID=2703900 RepID=UPI00197D4EB0|nr:PDR/VanB family oxidoreductase [Burkholderia sp. Ac-20379]MBN3723270.1 oxidoreductase [Burkholderia sp. Ac-20379]
MSNHVTPLDRHPLVVRAIAEEAAGIRSFELAAPDGAALPGYAPGAHLAVHLGNGITRQYSLYEAHGPADRYRIAVLNDPASRGGSRYLHEAVRVGTELRVSGPFNHFPMSPGARRAVLIAGGIGITPILSMASQLHRDGTPFTLHYCARRERDAAFVARLRDAAPFRDAVRLHFDDGDPARGLDVVAALAEAPDGCHVYCCGPGGLMNAVEQASAHWPVGAVHFERFAAEPVAGASNAAFRVVLRRSGREFDVPADKTILQVLRAAGLAVPTVCEQGVCGACLTDVAEGVPDHRDRILTDGEKAANDVIAVCCSRARSERLVLDL